MSKTAKDILALVILLAVFYYAKTGTLPKLDPIQLPAVHETQEVSNPFKGIALDADCYPKNAAESYYWYGFLSEEEQAIYHAMYELAMDPYDVGKTITLKTSKNPGESEFHDSWNNARFSLLYDHPEFFYLMPAAYSEDSELGDLRYRYYDKHGDYTVEILILDISPKVPELISRFNRQTRRFLEFLDMGASQEEIAKKLHDLLIHNVGYDDAVMELEKHVDLAHTAYGAICTNSEGDAFHAVCDGYSLGYHYLLQQCGIPSLVLEGDAGTSQEDFGAHCWNMVKLNGQWKETDVTWNDIGSNIDDLKKDQYYDLAMRAYQDPAYYEKITHYLYMVSTAQMNDYDPGSSMRYYDGSGRWYSHVGKSFHRRRKPQQEWSMGNLMQYAPIAY